MNAETVRAGRPKSEQKGELILHAASRLFLEHGLKETSMDAVAKEAGVSKQTVYSHFANKEALFTSCITCKVESYGFDEVSLPGEPDLRGALGSLVGNFVNLLLDPDVVAMHRVVMSEAAKQPRIAELFFQSGPAKTLTTICSFLIRETEAGRLGIAPERVEYAAVQLTNMAVGRYQFRMMLGLIDHVDKKELKQHLQQVVDDFLRLYKTAADA